MSFNIQKCAILCMPRVGSVLASALIRQYQLEKFKMRLLSEYEYISKKHSEKEIENRFRNLKTLNNIKNEYPYLKLNVSSMSDNVILEYFMEKYSFIFIERKDKIDQLLSLYFAKKTKTFHANKENNYSVNNKIIKQPIMFEKDFIYYYLELLEKYENFKNIKIQKDNNYIEFFYEDFIDNYDNLYLKLGLLDFKSYIKDYTFIKSQKLYTINKLDLIENKEEFITWYNELVQPIERSSNGRTQDSESCYLGSSPSLSTNKKK